MKRECTILSEYTLVIDMPLMENLHENVWNIDGESNVPTLRFGDERGVYCNTGRATGRYLAVLDLSNTGWKQIVDGKTDMVITYDMQATSEDREFGIGLWDMTYSVSFSTTRVGGQKFTSSIIYPKNTNHTTWQHNKIPGTDPFSVWCGLSFDFAENTYLLTSKTSNNSEYDYISSTFTTKPCDMSYLQICQTYYSNNTLWYGYMKNLKIYIK